MKRSDKLYALTALFDTPNQIIHAAKAVAEAGYTKFDVNTPYPVHGMDDAMKLKPSKLPLFTLAFGLTGMAIAFFGIVYMMIIDYPQVIGGKPMFSLPAYAPVMFEVTVLLATTLSVATMIALFFKFPGNAHPLHDTPYMAAVSHDKYGVVIEATDPLFDVEKVKALFAQLHGHSVGEIYEPEKENIPTLTPRFVMLLVGVAIAVSGGTYVTLNKAMYLPPFDWMYKQFRMNPQSETTFFKDGMTNRMPVAGTVAQTYIPYEYMGMPMPATPLSNPLLANKQTMDLGKAKYNTYCSPCHGNFGNGDSRLRGQFPNPPSLHSAKLTQEWKDGNIYHVITNGQNVMPSYASQMSREERWAVVTYIRALQRAQNASPEDIATARKETANNVR